MTPLDLLRKFEDIYQAMFPATINENDAFIWLSGIPHPLFNAVMHCKDKHFLQCLKQIEVQTPLSFWDHSENDSTIIETVKEKGFNFAAHCSLVSWDVKNFKSIKKGIISPAKMDDFKDIMKAVFHMNSSILNQLIILMKNTDAENYLIYEKDKPIGTGTLIPFGKVGGVFNIAVLPEFQKKGYGTAIIEFLKQRAIELNIEKIILLTSSDGEKLYRKVGFKKALDVKIYVKT